MAIVTVDIGNSALKWARWEDGVLLDLYREETAGDDGAVTRMVSAVRPDDEIVVVSVVPEILRRLNDALQRRSMGIDVIVTARVTLPFRVDYRTPETLGADRIAAAAGAVSLALKHGRPREPIIVVDAGTALTLEMLDGSGGYLGGTIGPGPGLMRDALHHGTAQLPRVELEAPSRIAGSSTDEAIRSGLMHGFAGMVSGLVVGAREELGGHAWVVGTGGWSAFLADATGVFDIIDPHLVLRGAEALARLNRP